MACLVDELPVLSKGVHLLFNVVECSGITDVLVPVDIRTASSLNVVFTKPDDAGTIVEKVGTIYTGGTNGDGTDGIIEYITEEGFIDITGEWKAQAIATFPTNPIGEFPSSISYILVVPTLRHPAD